ncbi:MAG TPA: hypothetical protein VFG79_06110 [Solirubrobacter sp.]|nr:hypothetical protein [Solirubrobacter sp.]
MSAAVAPEVRWSPAAELRTSLALAALAAALVHLMKGAHGAPVFHTKRLRASW